MASEISFCWSWNEGLECCQLGIDKNFVVRQILNIHYSWEEIFEEYVGTKTAIILNFLIYNYNFRKKTLFSSLCLL